MDLTNFPNGVTSFGMPVIGAGGFLTTGNVFFVDDAGSDSGYGTEPDASFATIDYAIERCTASHGDVIFVKEGHAETVTTAITLDVIGVTIIGLGHGDKRPTITVNGAVNLLNITAADNRIHNVRFATGSSVTAATRFARVAASNILIQGCQFEMSYDMYHNIVTISGDDIQIRDCTFFNTVTTSASVHPQTCILNTLATHVLVKNCRFNDCGAKLAERWRAVCEGGGLASKMTVEDSQFIVRGIATRTRSAAASDGTGTQSPTMATLYCRAISPSANTAVGGLFVNKCQYIIESYNVAAVNKLSALFITSA